jgi:rhodanese-related sulfurtransferase
MEPISRKELLRRVEAGEVVVLDVRPRDEYEAGHIAGARCIPLSEVEQRLEGIPSDRDIVAYCRGPYCVLALKAVEILRRRGRRAFRLVEGFPEWREAGLPVEHH